MELDYIKPSPSRTEKDGIIALYPYGRGQGVGSNRVEQAGSGDQGVGFVQGGSLLRRSWQQERGPEHCLQPFGLV